MKQYKPYPEYKDSTIDWIDKIPKHWQVLRNFAIFADRSDRGYPHLPPFSVTQREGVIPQAYTADQIVRSSSKKENGKRICKGDLVYNKMRMWQGAVGIAPAEGRVSTAYVVCQPIRDLIPAFFEYLYRTPLYMGQSFRFSYGGCKDQYCLYPKDFKNIYTIFPPKQEQAQIVNFLDHKTEQINELTRIKERQIELLHEYRASLINQTVTKGLDPNVEMKPSGVEWIGEIPAHWEIRKIKYIATLVSQKSTPETDAIKISPENVESETGKVLDFYSPYDSDGVKFQAGDVLFNKLRVYLSKVVFAEYSGYSLGEMIVIRPSLQHAGKYLFYLMLSCRFLEYCNSISYGVKMPRTDVDDILNAQIPMTSYQEQAQIADFLDWKTGQIDELIAIEGRKVELLKEYRQSLISHVVTGKIDIRNEV